MVSTKRRHIHKKRKILLPPMQHTEISDPVRQRKILRRRQKKKNRVFNEMEGQVKISLTFRFNHYNDTNKIQGIPLPASLVELLNWGQTHLWEERLFPLFPLSHLSCSSHYQERESILMGRHRNKTVVPQKKASTGGYRRIRHKN